MLRYFQASPRLSEKAIENRKEDLARLQAERGLGDAISAFLFVVGLLTILFFTIQTVNEYFGERELYRELESGAATPGAADEVLGFDGDEFYALTNFLRDLMEGWVLGGIAIGAAWLVARSLLRWTRDDEYVTVGSGAPEAVDARVTDEPSAGAATATRGSPGYRDTDA